jgi:GT2 family glycosyltransferase/glycosyltransferase involved in cell wall biosynthesis
MINGSTKTVKKIIRESGLFDARFYCSRYSDVEASGILPLDHFLRFGASWRRCPNPLFSADYYLAQLSDQSSAIANPLLHYFNDGWQRGFDPHPLFSVAWYSAEYPDIARSGTEPLGHFLREGVWQGCRPHPRYSLGETLRACPDLARRRRPPIKRLYYTHDIALSARFVRAMRATYSSDIAIAATRVSVVMPTYNRASLISRAIASVAAQKHANVELIVADDGSTDDTKVAVAQASAAFPSTLRYLALPHRGVSAARNAALDQATGQYIAYLDSDNLWHPHFLATMLAFVRMHHLDAAYSSVELLNDAQQCRSYRGDVFHWGECLKRNYIDLNCLVHSCGLTGAAPEGVSFDDTLERFVDWDFILRLCSTPIRVSHAPFVGVTYNDSLDVARITTRVYQDPLQRSAAVEKIRNKHSSLAHALASVDTGSGLQAVSLSHEANRTINKDISSQFYTFYFPDYTSHNPYQRLLYKSMARLQPAPGALEQALQHALAGRGQQNRYLFHLHWVSPILAGARTEDEALAVTQGFMGRLRLFRSLGGRVLWTVHNAISHETSFPNQELKLCRELAKEADLIHVHQTETIADVAPFYDLPADKLIVAPHGNYIDAYPTKLDKERARKILGVPRTARMALFAGQIRGYKGIDSLLAAYEAASSKYRKSYLIIAGKVVNTDASALQRQAKRVARVLFQPGYIDDDLLGIYLRAADAMVLPYRSVLTSGSALLAMSHGLPVICPQIGALQRLIRDGHNGWTYNAGHAGGLEDALKRFFSADSQTVSALGRASRLVAESYSWESAASEISLRAESLYFGEPMSVGLPEETRTWHVKGNLGSLQGRDCVATVVHFSDTEDTAACIHSILLQDSNIGVLIVSNSDKVDDLRALSRRFPTVICAQSQGNIGYAAANNLGLWLSRKVRSKYFWLLNPDIVLPVGAYTKLASTAEEWPHHDFFGSTLVKADQPDTVLFCGGSVDFEHGAFPTHIHMGQQVATIPTKPFECDYLTGSNIFGRTEALEQIGYLPEHYFLYFEETHWFCAHYRNSGARRPLVVPSLVIANRKRSENNGMPTPYYIYYFCRNALHFGRAFSHDRAATTQRVRSFADAWLKKIGRSNPNKLSHFRALVIRAFEDYASNINGAVRL